MCNMHYLHSFLNYDVYILSIMLEHKITNGVCKLIHPRNLVRKRQTVHLWLIGKKIFLVVNKTVFSEGFFPSLKELFCGGYFELPLKVLFYPPTWSSRYKNKYFCGEKCFVWQISTFYQRKKPAAKGDFFHQSIFFVF